MKKTIFATIAFATMFAVSCTSNVSNNTPTVDTTHAITDTMKTDTTSVK